MGSDEFLLITRKLRWSYMGDLREKRGKGSKRDSCPGERALVCLRANFCQLSKKFAGKKCLNLEKAVGRNHKERKERRETRLEK